MNIVFIHQSAELYGSDKTLLKLVTGLQEKGHRLRVMLPEDGPLAEMLRSQHIQVFTAQVLKLSRGMFRPLNLLMLPYHAVTSYRSIQKALGGQRPDLIYSNTLAVLAGLLYSKFSGIPHVWHVHEIVRHPTPIRKLFTRLIRLKTNQLVIYNSHATKNFWEDHQDHRPSAVVWNGVESTSLSSSKTAGTIKAELFKLPKSSLVIGLIGRINRWKGQNLLLDAFKELCRSNQQIGLVFVGSAPPGQDFLVHALEKQIVADGLSERVKIIPFQRQIGDVWAAIDIAVVPSTEPEPFGLVAVEAMLHEKPVVAAAHGGLAEIVADGETGFLFEPGNSAALVTALQILLNSPEKRLAMGSKGKHRAETQFGLKRYIDEIEQLCLNITKR